MEAIDITKVTEAPKLWQDIVDASNDGWIWHTWLAHEFNLCAREKFKAEDNSFFIYENEEAVGVVSLIIQEGSIGNFKECEVPWPCFRAGLKPERASALETFAFTELEQRARRARTGRASVLMIPPMNQGNERERVARVASEHNYLYFPLSFHEVNVSPNALEAARTHYDYKHFSSFFTITVTTGSEVTDVLEETYFKLHTKDAGGQFRSRLSYKKQADIARQGMGFYVVARHNESSNVAGMALINCYKGAAYYNSVAVDPVFQKLCVGYQLQCRAIEELLRRGILLYDLGSREDISTWHALTSEKKRGIARFKDKFSHHQSRDIYYIEKFLDMEFFHAYLESREASLKEYFGLS